MIYTSMVVVWNAVTKAQSTLISQAHGSKNVTAMRGWFILSIISMMILSSFVAILWVFSDRILLLAGFDGDLVRKGYQYTIMAIPSLFMNTLNITAAVYLSCMQCPSIPLLIAFLSCIIDTAITYWFLFVLHLDLAGAAQTWSLTTLVTLICNIFALRWAFKEGRELQYGEDDYDLEESGESLAAGLLGLNNGDDNDDKKQVHYKFADSMMYITNKKHWLTFLGQLFPNFISDLFANSQYQAVSFMAATLGSVQIAAHNGALAILEVSLVSSFFVCTSF